MRGLGLKFRLFGFPVTLDPGFFLLVVLLYLANLQNPIYGLIIAGCILVSVMIHEFGHAVVARTFGLRPAIRMTFIGGLTIWSREEGNEPSNLQYILITLAGPFAGFAFGGLVLVYCLIAGIPISITLSPSDAIGILLLFNFVWGLANLLPLYPLDGGQVLYYTLRLAKKLPAERISALISIGLGVPAAIWAYQADRLWIALLLVWVISPNFQRLRSASPKREEMRQIVHKIQILMRGQDAPQGLQNASQLLKMADQEQYRAWATEVAALFLDMRNDGPGTLAFIGEHRRQLSTSDAMRFLKLKAEGDLPEAMAFAARALNARATLTLLAVYASEMIRQGRLREAYEETISFEESSWFDQAAVYIQHQFLKHAGYREVVELGELARKQKATPELLYNMACANARLGSAVEALRCLEDAMRQGFRDHAAMSTDEDLRLLWDHHAFIDLLARMKEKSDREAAQEASKQAVGEENNALPSGPPGKD
ncbi:MAG: site-2 protease family protein [Bacteroidota bacterium]